MHASYDSLSIQYSIPRSRKHRNFGGSEGADQGFPAGYGFYVPQSIYFSFLIPNHSQDPQERWKENGSGRQNGGQQADG